MSSGRPSGSEMGDSAVKLFLSGEYYAVNGWPLNNSIENS